MSCDDLSMAEAIEDAMSIGEILDSEGRASAVRERMQLAHGPGNESSRPRSDAAVTSATVETCEDPWSGGFVPQWHAPESADITAYDKLYSFLRAQNNEHLRRIIRVMSPEAKRACGSLVMNERKNFKVNKLLLHASLKVALGASFESMFNSQQVEWTANLASNARYTLVAPAVPLPRNTAPPNTFTQLSPSTPVAPDFSTNEFGRLLGILIDGGFEIRRKLLNTGQSLSRSEIDAGTHRDEVWWTTIKSMFNDDSIQVSFQFDDILCGVDPKASRIAHRSMEKLLAVFNKNKAVFTKLYRNWTVSGQYNTDTVGDIISSRRSDGSPREEGKRALMTFFALKCGTPGADVDFLEFSMKLAPAGVAYDDHDVDDCAMEEVQRGGRFRKPKQIVDAEMFLLKDGNSILKEEMSAVVQSFSAKAPVYDGSTTKRAKDIAELTKELSSLYTLLEPTKSDGRPVALISRIEQPIHAINSALTEIKDITATGRASSSQE